MDNGTDNVKIPDYIIDIVEPEEIPADDAAAKEIWSTRWARGLKAAIEHGEDRAVIRQVALYFMAGGTKNDLAAAFEWVGILQTAGWTRDDLNELLFDRFVVSDPNGDLPTQRRLAFFRHQPAWWLVEPDEMVRFVENRMVRYHPEDVLDLNTELVQKIGQAEADRLAKEACRYVDRVFTIAAAETVRRLGHSTVVVTEGLRRREKPLLVMVGQRLAGFALQHGFAHTSVIELGLIVEAALMAGDGTEDYTDIWFGLKRAIEWHGRSQKLEVEHAITAFRWLIKLAREAPFKVKTWMRDPEATKRRELADFEEKLRKIMENLGFRFVRAEEGRDTQCRPQLEARHADKVFVQSNRPNERGDALNVGDEVIISKPEGKPDFRCDGGKTDGYIVHLHPVVPPTPTMIAAVEANRGQL
ncbi:MAG: hypothetical protein V1664_05600 [Candidatus Uhrbacteria bacterium]